MDREHVHGCPFVAGRVERYSSWPTINTETVDAHSMGVLRIYMELFGMPLQATLEYIVAHDYGEQWAGDIPFGGKLSVPGLKEKHAEAERHGLAKLGMTLPDLMPLYADRVKLCDLLQMYEFGRYEESMGNKFAGPIVVVTEHAAMELATKLNMVVQIERWMMSGRRP